MVNNRDVTLRPQSEFRQRSILTVSATTSMEGFWNCYPSSKRAHVVFKKPAETKKSISFDPVGF
jgi:hypothetical protein